MSYMTLFKVYLVKIRSKLCLFHDFQMFTTSTSEKIATIPQFVPRLVQTDIIIICIIQLLQHYAVTGPLILVYRCYAEWKFVMVVLSCAAGCNGNVCYILLYCFIMNISLHVLLPVLAQDVPVTSLLIWRRFHEDFKCQKYFSFPLEDWTIHSLYAQVQSVFENETHAMIKNHFCDLCESLEVSNIYKVVKSR